MMISKQKVLQRLIDEPVKNKARACVQAAIAAFHLGGDGNRFIDNDEFINLRSDAFKDSDIFGMYWAIPSMVYLYATYKDKLTKEHEAAVCNVLREFYYVCGYCIVNADARAERVYLSENHDTLMKHSMYLITEYAPHILTKSLRGREKDEVKALLKENINNTLNSIVKDGWLIEGGEPYNSVTLESLYNVMELSPDSALAAKSKKVVDIFWLFHAQESINGVRGFARSRVYPGWRDHSAAWVSSLFAIYTGVCGVCGTGKIDYLICYKYEMPRGVYSILEKRQAKTPYTVTTKLRGAGYYILEKHRAKETGMPDTPIYYLDNYSKILRTTYITEDYSVSGVHYPLLMPTLLISAHYRWEGITFAEPKGVSVGAVIHESNASFFDSFVTMHYKNRIIYAPNKKAYCHIPSQEGVKIVSAASSEYNYHMEIGIMSMGHDVECIEINKNLMVFKINSSIFAAETDNGYTVSDGKFIVNSQRVVLTAGTTKATSLEQFIEKVKEQRNTFGSGCIVADDGEDEMVFYYNSDSENIRMINGEKVNYSTNVYTQSPFIYSKVGTGEFLITGIKDEEVMM